MKKNKKIWSGQEMGPGHHNQEPVFDATIRWCLLFEDDISKLKISLDTPCTLLGMIEWHELSKIMNQSKSVDKIEIDALEEKMVLLEDGIPCTLRHLQEGSIKARLLLEFSVPHSEREVFRDSTWEDIHCDQVKEIIRIFQDKIHNGKTPDTRMIRLACKKVRPGGFAQRSLKYRAALALAKGVGLDEISLNQANRYAAQDIINKKEYLVMGARTRFSLQSESGEIIDQQITHLC